MTVNEILRISIRPIVGPLSVAACTARAFRFRRDVLKQMSLTISELSPNVVIGVKVEYGDYIEIYLEFREFRIRITRERYSRQDVKLWAEVAAKIEPNTFFRVDLAIAALGKLSQSVDRPISVEPFHTLAELDLALRTMHAELAFHMSPHQFTEFKKVISCLTREAFL